jgi:hypothetical protein
MRIDPREVDFNEVDDEFDAFERKPKPPRKQSKDERRKAEQKGNQKYPQQK